jgi:hypothetical protein
LLPVFPVQTRELGIGSEDSAFGAPDRQRRGAVRLREKARSCTKPKYERYRDRSGPV